MYCPRVPTARTVKVNSLTRCCNSHRCHRKYFCVMVTEGSNFMGLRNHKPHLLGNVLSKTLRCGHACHKECSSPSPARTRTNQRTFWQICSSLVGQPSTLASIILSCHCKLVKSNLSVVHLFSRCPLFVWEGFLLVEEHGLCMVNGKCCMPHAPHSKPFQFSLPPRRKKHRPKRSRSFPVPYLERLARCYCVDRVMRWSYRNL